MAGRVGYHAGLESERSVARHYLRAGYSFAAHRFRGQGGEIDLIMRKADLVVFIEVKHSQTHARAAERLARHQMDRISASAADFLTGEPFGQDTPSRFDVALVDGQGRIEVLENAFSE